MKPMGIGTDIIEIKRMRKALEKNEHFEERVFTKGERTYCKSRKKQMYASFTGIYAAKEAFVKAIGTGFREGSWHELEVGHTRLGAPTLSVKGTFRDIMYARGYTQVMVTISHCKEYAVAQVLLR